MERKWIVAIVLLVAIAAGGFFAWKWNRRHQVSRLIARDEAIREVSRAIRSGRCEEAIRMADAYLAEDPNVEEILIYKGGCLFDAGRFDEARQVFTNVLAQSPENVAAKNYLALLASRSGGVLVSEEGLKKMQMDKSEFERVLRVKLDSRFLTFVRAQRQPETKGFAESLYAVYAFSRNSSNVLAYVRSELEKAQPISLKSTPTSILVELSNKETLQVTVYGKGQQIVFDYAKLP